MATDDWPNFGSSPEALQRRVDFKGLADLVDALRSVGAFSRVTVDATELVIIQAAKQEQNVGKVPCSLLSAGIDTALIYFD